jgi:acylphosphatase
VSGSRRNPDDRTPAEGPTGAVRQPDDPATRLDALVHGRVQGVGYRFFAVEAAIRLGLAGWVANLADGRVRCVAEGPRHDLEALLVELRRGPAGAHVAGVAASWLPATGGLDGFSVRPGGHAGD